MERNKGTGPADILRWLVIAQIICCLLYTGNMVIFNSNLRLWLNQDYFLYQKLNAMLGYDYQLSQGFSSVPEDAGILLVPNNATYFINYYLLPRKLYVYPMSIAPTVTSEADLKKVPAAWLKEKGIDQILIYNPPHIRLIDLKKKGD